MHMEKPPTIDEEPADVKAEHQDGMGRAERRKYERRLLKAVKKHARKKAGK